MNCTFAGNSADLGCGGAVYLRGSILTVDNCILWGNTDSGCLNGPESTIYVSRDFEASATASYSCLEVGIPPGVTDGGGNIHLDPLFCDADGPDDIVGTTDDNLRLQDPSPCIDAALDSFLPSDSGDVDDDGNTTEILPWDLDKRQRVFDLVNVDMGAYENQHDIDCPADFDGDGDVGAFDLAVLLGNWGTCPGCPADLNCDGEVDAADLAILLGSWGPCPEGASGGGSAPEGPGGDDSALIEALGVMGFADVDEFNAWIASVPTDEAYAATQQLLALLTE